MIDGQDAEYYERSGFFAGLYLEVDRDWSDVWTEYRKLGFEKIDSKMRLGRSKVRCNSLQRGCSDDKQTIYPYRSLLAEKSKECGNYHNTISPFSSRHRLQVLHHFATTHGIIHSTSTSVAEWKDRSFPRKN